MLAAVPIRAKRIPYAIAIDRDGGLTAEGQARFTTAEPWTSDHLLLAALVRCTLGSLDYHARRLGLSAAASGSASGIVTVREADGRYAFVEIECDLEIQVEPEPSREKLALLLTAAERDCFVGATLTVKPQYRWRVNGNVVS